MRSIEVLIISQSVRKIYQIGYMYSGPKFIGKTSKTCVKRNAEAHVRECRGDDMGARMSLSLVPPELKFVAV